MSQPSPSTPPPEHDLLRAALREAGDAATIRFRRAEVSAKEDDTFVTDADHAAELILSARLREGWPNDGLVGEEGAAMSGDRTWFIDPIDGTHAFLEGLAHWGPTVGLVGQTASGDAEITLGATYFPRIDEFWFGARGGGAWRDGRRLPPLAEPVYDRRSVLFIPSRFHRWFESDHVGKCRSLGSTAAHLCLVAGGAAWAAFVPGGWGVWDVAGGLCLLEEVGGVARAFDGSSLDPLRDRGLPFLAGHPAAVERAIQSIRLRAP